MIGELGIGSQRTQMPGKRVSLIVKLGRTSVVIWVSSHYLVDFVARSCEGQSEKPNVGPLGVSDSQNRRPLVCLRWSMPVGQVHLS